MMNLYWPIYKNLEKELLALANQIHIDDHQLEVYSIKIAELLLRCAVEIEAISKELFYLHGGTDPVEGDLYFDTDCIHFLEDKWILSKKKLIVSAPIFYFEEENNQILTPLLKANKRGTSGCDWKKAYQGIKHNRTVELKKGNLKNLIRALGALFILNVYFKNEIFFLDKDQNATNFPLDLGSEIFTIKLHKWQSHDGNYNYDKAADFHECIYLNRYTAASIEKNKKATVESNEKFKEQLSRHPKFLGYLSKPNQNEYKGTNLALDALGKEEYLQLLQVSNKALMDAFNNSQYEAILNTCSN